MGDGMAACAFCGSTVGLQMVQREIAAGGCYWVCQKHVSMVEGRATATPSSEVTPHAESRSVLRMKGAQSGVCPICSQPFVGAEAPKEDKDG